MTKRNALIIVVAGTIMLSTPLAAAQETQGAAAPQECVVKLPGAKSHILWTNDDVKALRSPADVYAEKKQMRAAEAAAAATLDATEAKQAAAKAVPGGAPPALSNPETIEDADKMIAWENRDIDAQQQFVEQLRTELDQAPFDQKERLQKMLQQHVESLANTRKEMESLLEKKKEIDKKAATGNTGAASAAPPQ
jgi:hypothetical protein